MSQKSPCRDLSTVEYSGLALTPKNTFHLQLYHPSGNHLATSWLQPLKSENNKVLLTTEKKLKRSCVTPPASRWGTKLLNFDLDLHTKNWGPQVRQELVKILSEWQDFDKLWWSHWRGGIVVLSVPRMTTPADDGTELLTRPKSSIWGICLVNF